MSFELDAGGDASPGSFDDHSVSISSDGLGTFKFSGNSGSSAVSAIDGTAAGDVFDTFDTKVGGASASTAAPRETKAKLISSLENEIKMKLK